MTVLRPYLALLAAEARRARFRWGFALGLLVMALAQLAFQIVVVQPSLDGWVASSRDLVAAAREQAAICRQLSR